jgi:hypothetical protein
VRPRAQNSDGLAHGAQVGSEDAGGLEESDPAGAERMDLLGHLGQTRCNARSPNPARNRGSSGGKTPSLLLAWLSASPTQRAEVVRETSALTDCKLRPVRRNIVSPMNRPPSLSAVARHQEIVRLLNMGDLKTAGIRCEQLTQECPQFLPGWYSASVIALAAGRTPWPLSNERSRAAFPTLDFTYSVHAAWPLSVEWLRRVTAPRRP